jgi:hypothetical protein
MKRLIIGAGEVLLGLMLWASAALAFGMNDVMKMHDYGVADSLIVLKIQHSGARFHLDPGDLAKLQKAGISNEVVGAMLATEKPEPPVEPAPVYAYDPWYSMDPWYPFGPPFYPRVSVGWGYHYLGHPYFPRAFTGPRPFPVAPGPRYKVGPA